MRTDQPQPIYLKDYKAPDYQPDHLDLSFDIRDGKTVVTNVCKYKNVGQPGATLYLDGEDLTLVSCRLDGKEIEPKISDSGLEIENPGSEFVLEIINEIEPENNTRLEGLYKSGGTYCTQCEAHGFRRITYYQDRPDVMAPMTVRVEADKNSCPVLLSNGNRKEVAETDNGRHFAVYDDPFPKPCYLFALVAGDLVYKQDNFTTRSGRDVDLRIYVREGDENQIDHAMDSLKKSMEWDEQKYGLEYNYDHFNIVAVGDFNMGAMENTSLNIFNTALVLAHQETATDQDFMRVESVIAHEYFHNWTGNRITCRDWFQLSLKEGFTVFRDQQFSEDMHSESVERIDQAAILRRVQFPEDAGAMAHPVRPDNYIEIDNFYTPTVYNKGAEVIRMMYNILGPETFRKATDLYFDRHDGQAVRCEEFVKCMEDASGRDLSQFWLWYEQAGTPEVTFEGHYNESDRTYNVKLKQNVPDTPGQTNKKPMHIPVRIGLIGQNGQDIEERVLDLTRSEQVFTFENVGSKPVPSVLRHFSAPVRLKTDLSDEDWRFLMIHDSDGFNQWEASQNLAMNAINQLLDTGKEPDKTFFEAYGELIERAMKGNSDKALLARALALPDVMTVGQERDEIDPGAIYEARKKILEKIGNMYVDRIERLYELNQNIGAYSKTSDAIAQRSLKNAALHLLSYHQEQSAVKIARLQYTMADNMTDRAAALSVLTHFDTPERDEVFNDFLDRFKDKDLVVDKWFAYQAMAVRPDTNEMIRNLRNHELFHIQNPNRVRSLYAAFAMNNPVCFHDPEGSGYEFLKQAVIDLNAINPQIAARLLNPFRQWKRYTPERREKMYNALKEIAANEDLSANVYEVVSKSLKDVA